MSCGYAIMYYNNEREETTMGILLDKDYSYPLYGDATFICSSCFDTYEDVIETDYNWNKWVGDEYEGADCECGGVCITYLTEWHFPEECRY